jgi:hypothetical protein
MSSLSRVLPGLCLAALLLSTLPACRSIGLDKDDFRAKGGELYRGTSKFTLHAFHAPGVGESRGSLDRVIPAMVRAAEVGGNALCLDLAGFNEQGTAIDPADVQTVDSIAHRAKDTRMAVIVRVLGDSTDPDFRRRAVRTAAKALERQGLAVYLIDGPGAAELAAEFKKRAPHRVVIAPENGDLALISERPAEYPGHLAVLDNVLPDFALGAQHFIMADEIANYEALDLALMREVEKNPPELDPAILSEEERAEGFVPLFDGKTLDGWWFKDESAESFHVTDCGFIEWREKGSGAIMTARRYGNFVLRCDWKILPGGNSGVWLRAPRGSRESKIGIEFQLMGDSTVEEPTKTSTGSVYDVIPATAVPANREGEWNSLEVHFDGPHYKAWINGVMVQDLNFEENEELRHRLRRGFICLTDHGDYCAYRNIRIKELPE